MTASMKLRTKTIIAIIVIVFLIFGALQAIAIFVIQPGFKNLENSESQKSVIQIVSTIDYRLSGLGTKVEDYASWDDTYNFIQNRNQDYTENNFIDETFQNLNLNLVAIVDNNRSLVYCQSFDLPNATMVATSSNIKETLV